MKRHLPFALICVFLCVLTVAGCVRTNQEQPTEIIPHDACSINLIELGMKLRLAIGNGDKFPPSLASLTDCTNTALFVCPTTGHVPGAMSNVEDWTDFIYVGSANEGMMCDVALLISPPENHAANTAMSFGAAGTSSSCRLDKSKRSSKSRGVCPLKFADKGLTSL